MSNTPVAIRELINDETTGALKVVLKDAATGAQIELSQAAQYNIAALNSMGGLVPVNEGITTPVPTPEVPTAPAIPVVAPTPAVPQELRTQGGGNGAFTGVDTSGPRTQSSNFGYVNKPGIMGVTNMVPGPIGLASRMANGVVNSNNAMAVSSARQSIGLDPLGAASIAKQTLSDNRGQLGDVNIGNETYSVGLEASTPKGRTNLTPNEARNRALTSGLGIRDATPEESAANIKANPVKSSGLLGGLLDKGKGLLGVESSSPLANTSKPAKVNDTSIGIGISPSVSRTNLAARPTTTNTQSSVGQPTVSRAVDNNAVRANKPMPSFAEASRMAPAISRTSIPSVPASQLGTVDKAERVPGLAGIARTPTISANSKANLEGLDPSIKGALAAVSGVIGPVSLNSGYRNPADNAKKGGVKKSQHMGGKAVDISTVGWSDTQKRDALEAAGQKGVKGIGIGFSDTMMHIDTRENPASWGYANGKAVSRAIKDQPSWAKKTLTDIKDAGRYQVGPLAGPKPTTRPDPKAQPKSTPESLDFENTTYSSSAIKGTNYNAPKSYAEKPASSFLGGDVSAAPAGMRNNNPGNLKYTGSSWQKNNLPGLVGPSVNTDEGDPQAVFSSPEAGLAAASRLAVGKYDSGMTTINDMVSGPKGWTPGKQFAADNIAAGMGVKPTDKVDLRDAKQLTGFMNSMMNQEHGPAAKAYTPGMVSQAVKDTLQTERKASLPSLSYDRFSPGLGKAMKSKPSSPQPSTPAPSESKKADDKDSKPSKSKSMSGNRTRSTSAGLGSKSSSNKGSNSKSDSKNSKSSSSKGSKGSGSSKGSKGGGIGSR